MLDWESCWPLCHKLWDSRGKKVICQFLKIVMQVNPDENAAKFCNLCCQLSPENMIFNTANCRSIIAQTSGWTKTLVKLCDTYKSLQIRNYDKSIHGWFLFIINSFNVKIIIFKIYISVIINSFIQSILFLAPTNSKSQPDSTLKILNKVKTEVKTWNGHWSSPPEHRL